MNGKKRRLQSLRFFCQSLRPASVGCRVTNYGVYLPLSLSLNLTGLGWLSSLRKVINYVLSLFSCRLDLSRTPNSLAVPGLLVGSHLTLPAPTAAQPKKGAGFVSLPPYGSQLNYWRFGFLLPASQWLTYSSIAATQAITEPSSPATLPQSTKSRAA